MPQYAIGVDLGGTTIKAGLVESSGGIVKTLSAQTGAEMGPDYVVTRIAELCEQLTLDVPPNTPLLGIGVGAPGVISWDRTSVSSPPNFPGWTTVNLADALGFFGVPVVVENDANAAGLGSAFYGEGRAFRSFLMITLGTGVGGAILYERRIFRGTTGGAGEFGHVTIDYEGPYARSGVAGAAEAYLGQHFLSRHARYQVLTRESVLHDMCGPELEGLTPKHLHQAAEMGDEAAREVLAWAGRKLGCLIGSAVNLLDIRKVVVGGGVSAAGDYLLEPARQTARRFVMPGLAEGVEVVRETLGNAVGILGAARLAFERVEDLERARQAAP